MNSTSPQLDFLGDMIKHGEIDADQGKIKAVAEWPTVNTRKQLQRFLGFANFYRRFSKGYPFVPFPWSDEAERVFHRTQVPFNFCPHLVLGRLVKTVDSRRRMRPMDASS